VTVTIDTSLGFGHQGAVFETLVEITRCDPGLGSFQLGPGAIQVSFEPKNLGVASSDRLLALVRHSQLVLITGAPSWVTPPGFGGKTLRELGGGAAESTAAGPIMVWLDVTEAGGAYYNVYDVNKQRIYSPPAVALYHELAHAYHKTIGDYTPGPPGEVQATADENAFRSQLGLPRRHPTDDYAAVGPPEHGGVTFPTCKPKTTTVCVVATAALGSPTEPTVAELRRARDEYRDLGAWTSLIADPVLSQYMRLGPGVAREMISDDALRAAVLTFTVQPVACLLAIVEADLAADDDGPDPGAAIDRILAEYGREAAEAGCAPASLVAAAEGATAAARQLQDGADVRQAPTDERHAPESLYGYLGSAVAAGGGDMRGFAWGFEGLALFLRRAAAKLGERADSGEEALEELRDWLGRLPLPARSALDLADAPRELQVLGARLFTRPQTRQAFARRLLEGWPRESAPALASVLDEQGFLPGSGGEGA
jgi:hypothetical protein